MNPSSVCFSLILFNFTALKGYIVIEFVASGLTVQQHFMQEAPRYDMVPDPFVKSLSSSCYSASHATTSLIKSRQCA
ncbi:hypothetical protein K474DRAFT_1516343 [Panus rudis PR-1116 ss-1]|nr:hypothetical protein K474DRAFT_1516343 [Panus rudis PR-1116 ss-1]